MRVICISDSHGLHDIMRWKVKRFVDPNQVNILLHAGDCTNVGKEHEIIEFVEWFKSINDFDNKIFIAGNHDFGFEHYGKTNEAPWLQNLLDKESLLKDNVTYLHDSEIVLNLSEFSKPIKIYGSPWQPWFYDWAFNLPRNGEGLELVWNKIPDDTDILITHGPVFGHLDYTPQNMNVGCEILRFRVEQIKPLIHVCGHIHHSHGAKVTSDTVFVNASTCDERYRPINKPIVIDVNEVYGELVTQVINE
jgi:Icc-related predicted phosphoesterase